MLYIVVFILGLIFTVLPLVMILGGQGNVRTAFFFVVGFLFLAQAANLKKQRKLKK